MSAPDMRLEAWLLADRYGLTDVKQDIMTMFEDELAALLITLRRREEGGT